jgi:hypothetical protein
MSKINETNYPRRTQANYADTDMLVIQAAGGNTYTTRLEDMREDYEETLAPTLSALQDDVNENLATIEAGSTASKVYAKGDYLVFGGKLCRVTSTSIAAGATLTIGTNIELAPVGDELKTLSSDLTDIVKTASSSTINLGALTSGSAGYGSTTVTIPSGYKTVGIANASKNHPGVGTAFNVMAFLQADLTGQATVDYTYSAVGSVAANAADFHIRVLCVRA